ncbi:hypothetical protein D3C84_1133190 [compost metagenome]
MVYQHHIRLGLHRGVQQGLAGGDAGDDPTDLRTPLDLQAVGAVILDARSVQVALRFFHQSVQGNGHGVPHKLLRTARF